MRKLTREQAHQIKYARGSAAAIARYFGVTKRTALLIRRGETWKEIQNYPAPESLLDFSIPPKTTKICPKCKDEKSTSSFSGKTSPYCKPCKAKFEENRRRNNGVKPKSKRNLNLIDSNLRECLKCFKALELNQFRQSSRGLNQLSPYCNFCQKLYQREIRAKNPEKIKTYIQKYRKTDAWRIAHCNYQQVRRANKRKLDTGKVSLEFSKELYSTENCFYCHKSIEFSRRTMDHKVPLSKGGLHSPDNLVMACLSCNSSKRDLTEEEFRQRGVLCKNTSR